MLVGPWVPHPKAERSVRAKLFLVVDDHSRLLVDGVFYAYENARACQEMLRRAAEVCQKCCTAITAPRSRTPGWPAPVPCWVSRLVHSQPYSPQGRGKQERLNRYIRDAFLAEATHTGIENLEALNDLFGAWAEQVANQRIHAETHQAPIERFEAGGPHRAVDPDRLREAFRWSVTRRVTRTATVPLEGNHYAVDPALVGRRIELRYDPEDLARLDAFHEGKPAGGGPPRS